MNMHDITDCRTAKPIELDHRAMHNDIDAQMAEFERLGGRVEQIPRGVHGDDALTKRPQPGYRNKCK